MSDRLAAFLAGELPDDVALYLADTAVDEPDRLADHGVRVDGGVVLVVTGERGRTVFQSLTGGNVMEFAQRAGNRDGEIDPELAGGRCPDATGEGDTDHSARFVFAFAEPQNDEVGDIYADGDVIHAYAQCECGTAYSERWVPDD